MARGAGRVKFSAARRARRTNRVAGWSELARKWMKLDIGIQVRRKGPGPVGYFSREPSSNGTLLVSARATQAEMPAGGLGRRERQEPQPDPWVAVPELLFRVRERPEQERTDDPRQGRPVRVGVPITIGQLDDDLGEGLAPQPGRPAQWLRAVEDLADHFQRVQLHAGRRPMHAGAVMPVDPQGEFQPGDGEPARDPDPHVDIFGRPERLIEEAHLVEAPLPRDDSAGPESRPDDQLLEGDGAGLDRVRPVNGRPAHLTDLTGVHV